MPIISVLGTKTQRGISLRTLWTKTWSPKKKRKFYLYFSGKRLYLAIARSLFCVHKSKVSSYQDRSISEV